VPILCLFVPTRKWSTFGKFLNGGDDETRTRDLCRDRDIKYSQQLTRLLGAAKYVIVPRSRTNLGLAFGLKIELSRTLFARRDLT
jgi:hypothetical protein